MSAPAYLAGSGAVASVGLNFPAIAAAVRGQLNAIRLHGRFPSARNGQPLPLARMPDEEGFARTDFTTRMFEMGRMAATECLTWAGDAATMPPIPLMLALPSARPGWDQSSAMRFAQSFAERLPVPVDAQRSGMVATGNHGGLALVSTALDMIGAGQASACLVGGIESMSADALDWLDRQFRLRGPDNPEGLVPGEAAAFVLVTSHSFLAERNMAPMAIVQGAIETAEPQPWYTGEPVTGAGLSAVAQKVLPAADRSVDVSYGDLNGEVWRSTEWATAYLRTGHRHASPLNLQHPADCWGDIGAASGPMLLALAAADLAEGRQGGARSAFVFCASDSNPMRAGAYVTALGAPAAGG